jgi:spermidine synthase
MQTADSDHGIYDKAILRELKKEDRNILILGGGDGYVAEEALNINPNLKVNVVDLDAEVIKGCEKFLDQKVFKDSRIKLCVEDAFEYLKEVAREGKKFDGIVVDLTDEPEREDALADFKKFYEKILALSEDVLKNGGWVSMQAGAAKTTANYFNAVSVLEKTLLEKGFQSISREDFLIPSFGEKNAFLYAKKK